MLQRASGATVAASAAGAQALRAGLVGPDDPLCKANGPDRFPKVAQVGEVADGAILRVGPLAIKAHMTPGHTTGGTTWTWQACEQKRCLDVVYTDRLNPISHDGFRFSGSATMPERVRSCRAYAANAGQRLNRRLASEASQ
ncbi:hypothetical protein [Massilia genomosp. 1]|uniref:Subclass B3 metallo-beta-lactamase n=1 Tax=Massilia genomosp. 1 TaxID=2609280 RepID=A0ABX0MHG9_9BURK|nr:hypothetical protein [Massilia genomosp. 1]NHZ62237.1 hypothetical protein [Massilia genomosp. 1]